MLTRDEINQLINNAKKAGNEAKATKREPRPTAVRTIAIRVTADKPQEPA